MYSKYWFCIVLLACSILFYSSCINDKCSGVVCANQGVCVQTKCVCPSGYEGAQCQDEWGKKFTGIWNIDDTYQRDTTGKHLYYDLQIASANTDSFLIVGLLDTLGPVKCKRTNLYTFTMPYQVLDSFVTVNSGKCIIDTNNASSISGIYSLLVHRDNSDTTITINTRWGR